MYDLASKYHPQRDPRHTTRSSFTQESLSGAQEANMRSSEELNRPMPVTYSTLEEIEQRIYKAMRGIDGLANLLNDHADRVHGTIPETGNGASACMETPPGQISRIFMALEALDGAVDRISFASGRNTTLA